jgi:hypothetical protein
VTGHELVLEVLALVIGIALVLATGLALLAAAASRASDDRTELPFGIARIGVRDRFILQRSRKCHFKVSRSRTRPRTRRNCRPALDAVARERAIRATSLKNEAAAATRRDALICARLDGRLTDVQRALWRVTDRHMRGTIDPRRGGWVRRRTLRRVRGGPLS